MKRKGIIIVVAVFFLNVFSLSAQSFDQGQVDFNFGLGLGRYGNLKNSYTYFPPLSLSVDYGITKEISVGGYFGYSGASWRYSGSGYCNNGSGVGSYFYTYNDTYKWRFYTLGVRGAYHFDRFIKINKIDLYAGLFLGNTFSQSSYSTDALCDKHFVNYSYSYGGFAYSLFLGGRYRFNEHFGVFTELGYGISYMTFGLNYKL